MKKRVCVLLLSVGFVLSLASYPAVAQSTVTIPDEYGKLIRQHSEIGTLGGDLAGDRVDLSNGGLEIVQTDIDLPGSNQLPVRVSRRFQAEKSEHEGHFRYWSLDMPNAYGTFSRGVANSGWIVPAASAADKYKRCSLFSAPLAVANQGATFNPDEYWHGSFFHLPGSGDQELLRARQGADVPSDGNAYPIVTKDRAAIRCVALAATSESGSQGEGFEVVMPDGVMYTLNQMVTRQVATLGKPISAPQATALQVTPQAAPCCVLGRQAVILFPTMVKDRLGNSVSYIWSTTNPWQLVRISASDGRHLDFTYQDATSSRVTSVSDGVRTWRYAYSSTTPPGDDTLTLPDGGVWKFGLGSLFSAFLAAPATCDRIGGRDGSDGNNELTGSATGSVTSPSGAKVEFTLSARLMGRSWVERQCATSNSTGGSNEYVRDPYLYATWALTSKKITGPGLPAAGLTWTYAYGAPNNCWVPMSNYDGIECTSSSPETRSVSVSDPDGGVTRYTFGNRYRVNEGLLLKTEYGWNGTSALRAVEITYADPGANPYASFNGLSIRARGDYDITSKFRPQLQEKTEQQGQEFNWKVASDCSGMPYCFDTRARPIKVMRSSAVVP